ncbi:uncharacterized protein LOC129255585 isoform X1 [Lytechinus pictus]|uniref:uncharacterized protein LOC129255585 isoform X1 n=1 Tax=Lytechinus pictus TaxID=7653 RepID=UPI0030BA0D8E
MNNSSDRNLWHTLLLAITCVVSFAVVIQAQDSSFSISFSSGDLLLPCVYRGQPHLHGDVWNVDECTACNCDNATVTCVIESCQPAFCAEPMKPVGECCFLCPYNVKVKKVLPEITSTNTIAEGGDNSIILDVPIKFQEAMDTTGVSGEDLWTLSAWASSTPDGRGPRYGYNRNVLDDIHEDQDYKKKDKFQFSDIDFRFNDPMAECEDMKYICVRIQRGVAPVTTGDLEYQFSGYPDDNVLTGCTGSPECIGIAAREMDWTLEPLETVIPGERTAVSIDNAVTFKENNPLLTGDGLWRMGLFGSRNAEGTGDRFSYVSQTLSLPQQGTTLNPNLPLEFMDAETEFEMGSVGCNEYGYVCVEFTGGDDPMPSFFFRVEDAIDSSKEANTLVSCREQECLSNVWAESLDWDLIPTDRVLPGQETGVSIDSTIMFEEDNREVAGSGLWRKGLFGSRNPDGSGERFNYQRQILDRPQQSITLDKNSGILDVNEATATFEIGTVGCNDFGYVCVEFTGGDSPNPMYYFRVVGSANDYPEENTLVTCKEQECLARAIFTDLDVDLGDQVLVENKNNFLNVDLSGITADDSTNVIGDELWKVSAYASQNPEGTGSKVGLVEQILDPFTAAADLNEGEDLPMDDVDFDFDMTDLRCEDVPYLCFDLDKNPDASVNFIYESRPNEAATTTCVDFRDRCKGATAIDVDWDLEVGDGPFDEPIPLTIDADVLFEPDSPDVNGDGLWQLGVFAAKNPEGSGPRKDEVTQVLDPLDQSVPLDEGGPLPLDDVDFPFPINEVGCSDYNYLCVEFKKGEAPSPDFKFETQSGEDSIISCKEQPCRGALPPFFPSIFYYTFLKKMI